MQRLKNATGAYEKVPSAALNLCRQRCGSDTIMTAGTCAGIGRGFSNVTNGLKGGEPFVFPPTLTCVVTPRGQSVEVLSQGLQRNACEYCFRCIRFVLTHNAC